MSDIDPNVFQDNIPTSKADLREQFTIAKEEITALETKTAIPAKMAYEDTTFDNL